MHQLRKQRSESFSNEITAHLKDLDMPNVQFEVDIIASDTINFQILISMAMMMLYLN